MVSTQDFESCDPGSIPGETYNLTIAQMAEQWTVNPCVGCSSHPSENISVAQWESAWPITRRTKDRNLAEISSVWRNWIAHQSSKLGVAGSNPVMDIYVRLPESGQRGAT